MLNDTDFVKYVAENYSYLVAEAVRKLEEMSVEQYLALVKKHYGDGVMGDLLTALSGDLLFAQKLVLNEHHLYGSSRLGVKTHKRVLLRKEFSISGFEEDGTYITDEVTDSLVYVRSEVYFCRVLAQKQYEMSNHLGNVLATVLDRRTGVFDEGADTLMYYVADVVSATLYYPFGSPIASRAYASGEYRYGWQNQERVDEISGSGNHYTAEHWEVDTRTGRRWNIDPVIKPWQSGYSILSNNPIVMVDPDGAADFYNQSGKKVGTDGVDDGKLYVLTTQADVKKARQSYYGKGMKGFFNIILGKGGQGTIQTSAFSGDVVSLPSANVRKEIGNAVDRSNSPTADDTKGGFHEEGGIWGTNAAGAEQVVNSNPGAYANPKTDNQATVNVFDAANPAEQGAVTNVQGTFHIHPSGTIVESSGSSAPGTSTYGGTTTTYSFEQSPSNVDVSLATQGGNTSGYNIVVGARNNTVYIHGTSSQNKAGTNYRATFPLDKFKSIGN